MFTIPTGIIQFLALAFVDVLTQNRTQIVGKSYGNSRVSVHFKWKSSGARAMSESSSEPLQSFYDCRAIFCPQIIIKNRAVAARSSQSPYGARTTCLWALVLRLVLFIYLFIYFFFFFFFFW